MTLTIKFVRSFQLVVEKHLQTEDDNTSVRSLKFKFLSEGLPTSLSETFFS